jgi:hypothetical protein
MTTVADRLTDKIFDQLEGRVGDDTDSVHLDRLREIVPKHGAFAPSSIVHNVGAVHDMAGRR